MKAPPNTTKILKAEAERLTNIIFRNKYCVVHFKKSGKQVFFKVEKHHLIKQGQSTRYKFDIWNILPVCENYHRWDKLSAHEAEDKFMAWVKENLPLHWSWYQEHRNENARHISSADWSDICDQLYYYVKHTYEAEQIIYEKGF